jgi:hypothetical protein
LPIWCRNVGVGSPRKHAEPIRTSPNACLTDAAIEWWGKAADQALRRSAFQEAIAHLGKAIEMADKIGVSKPRGVAAPTAAGQRLKLQRRLGPSSRTGSQRKLRVDDAVDAVGVNGSGLGGASSPRWLMVQTVAA